MSAAKSPSRAPPLSIELPTTQLRLLRTPASINIDVDGSDEEGEGALQKDARLNVPCIVVTSLGEGDNGAASSSAFAAASGDGPGPSTPAVGGFYWFTCPAGLLAVATALTATHKGAGYGQLPAPHVAAPIGGLRELVEALAAPSGSADAASHAVFFALSATSYRAYSLEGGVGASGGGDAIAAAGASASAVDDGADVSPSPARGRGSTKDKITSAVAFDFVSGIMKGVVGGDVDTLFTESSSEPPSSQ